jgi:hypothetical protein
VSTEFFSNILNLLFAYLLTFVSFDATALDFIHAIMTRIQYKHFWIFKEPGRECRNTVQMHDPNVLEVPPEYMFADTMRVLIDTYGARIWPNEGDIGIAASTLSAAAVRKRERYSLRRDMFTLSSASQYIMTSSSWFFWCALLSRR